MRMIEDKPDKLVELGFPLVYALSWGFPSSSPPDLYFLIFLRFFIFLCYGNIFIISIFFEIFRVSDIFRV